MTEPRAGRRDARRNREKILDVATSLLRQDPDATIDEIAHASSISRATLYRNFRTRSELIAAVREHSANLAADEEHPSLLPAGELSSHGPVVLDVTEVLGKVPPHLLGEQIVAEAQRLAGVRSVALYLIDIDGTRLQRHAGSQEFPEELHIPLAVGPEVPREGLPALENMLAEALPASTMAPMVLRERALGVLVAVDAPQESLLELGRQAAVALSLAECYTDVFDATRRRKDISAASEIQQNLLPPRIARISGGLIAGNVLPGYEIGGDWFDYVENPDGAWIAVADSAGCGTAAAAIGAVTLGAFRAKRRRQAPLEETVNYMEDVLNELAWKHAVCNVIVARWHGPTASFFWVSCGEGVPYLITPDRRVEPLPGETYESLGRRSDEREVKAHGHRLGEHERIVMVSDGVLERRSVEGGSLGIDIIREAIADLDELTAPRIVRSLERSIVDASADHLEDDATIVAFEPITAA